jgi:hypothetical protein
MLTVGCTNTLDEPVRLPGRVAGRRSCGVALARCDRAAGRRREGEAGRPLSRDMCSFDVDILRVRVESPGGVLRVLGGLPMLDYTFAMPDGEVRVDGARLRAHNVTPPMSSW